MARVNMEQSVFSDPRYRVLARELGVDVWSAIGRMTMVWNHCQETCSHVLREEIVNHLFEDAPQLSEALLKSELGKKHRHGIYISGSRGRIEWLENKRRAGRKNGKKGGRPKKTDPKPTENQDRLRTETPPAPAPALAPAPAVEDEKKKTPSESSKKPSAKELVESFVLMPKHREWGAKNCPSVPLEAELDAWRDRLRASEYKYGKARTPVADAQASFYTSCRYAEQDGRYRKGGSLFGQSPTKPFAQAPRRSE